MKEEQEIKAKESILYLDYIFTNQKPFFNKIVIENKEYSFEEAKNKNLEITFSDIEKELGSKILKMALKHPYGQKDHNFEMISGINIGILFPGIGNTRDIIFPEVETYKVEISSIKYRQSKEFYIKNKRLLLINFNEDYCLKINGILITSQIEKLCSGGVSSQISVVDLQKRILLSKVISPIQFDSFFLAYEKYQAEAKYFLESMDEFFLKNKFNYEEYEKLFFNDELIRTIIYKYNLPKKILKNEYNQKDYFEFIFSCSLYYIMHSLSDEKEINSTYKYFIKYKNDLEKDSSLEYYMRNIIIIELATMIKEKANIEKFEKLKFRYYSVKNLEKNSPLEASITFLNNFIKNIDENSPFLYPLILIDSGNYIYNEKNAYGYGLTNLEIVKSHLLNVVPDIIITIKDEEKKSGEAVSNKVLVSVKLNLASKLLSILDYFTFDKKLEDKDISSNLELILFLTFFHEVFGHKKGGYTPKKKDTCSSPNVFYDKKRKKILKLVNRNFLYLSDDEVPILRGDREEDAGYFLEYFIGDCEYGYYSEIIEIMLLNNINLNFILDVNMWNKDINIMRNFVRLKYIVYNFDKNLLNTKIFNNINDEIKELEKIIKEQNIDLKTIKKIKEIKSIEKNEEKMIKTKKQELDDLTHKEYEKYKNYSSEELENIAFDMKVPKKLREIAFNTILSRIIKK